MENASDDFAPAKEARKSLSKLRRKFATNFAEKFANFTLEIAGAYTCQDNGLGNTNLFTKCLFTILVPLDPLSFPKQRSDRFSLENCEHAAKLANKLSENPE